MAISNFPQILFEDDDLVVLDKSAGWVVNAADSTQAPAIQDWFSQNYPTVQNKNWETLVPQDFSAEFGSPDEVFSDRRGMVHRLDKDTSGVLLLAKNPGSLVNLLAQFRLRQVQKKYVCLVHGGFKLNQGEIVAPLGRSRKDRQKFAVDISGRPAVTLYSVLEFFTHLRGVTNAAETAVPLVGKEILTPLRKERTVYLQGFSLVECTPKTGRTHQIRVHLAHIHHPLVGDITYCGSKRAKLDPLWCPRQFLHATELKFKHPRTNEELVIQSPLPTDLKKVLEWVI